MEIEKLPPSTRIEDRRGQVWNQPDTGWRDAVVTLGAMGGFAFLQEATKLAMDGGTWEHFPRPSTASAYRVAGRFITRMVPWISAAELAVVLWEINHRRNDTLKETAKAGPAPGAPNYVPPGWYLYEERDMGPPENWVWNQFNPGANLATTSLVPGVWRDGVGGVWTRTWDFPSAPGVPKEMGIQFLPFTGPAFVSSGKQKWVYDGASPGSTISYYGDVIEWEPPQELWKVQPDVVPTILPDITNPAQRQRQAVPIPQRDLWRFPRWKREFGDLVYRQSVSPPPTRPADPGVATPTDEAPITEPQRPPRPRVPPRGSADDVIFTPDGHVSTITRGRNSHRFLPAPPKAREVKLRANTRRLAYKILSALTEFHDFVGAVHKALPKRCKKSRTWRDKEGKWHRALVTSMARDIYNCAGDINIQRAIINVVANSLQDLAVGHANRAANERTGMLGSSLGVQGLGTRVSRASSNDSGHWSKPITDAGDWIGSQSPGWTPRDIQQAWRRYTYGY